MNRQPLRPAAPRSESIALTRPRPTAGAALLVACVLSIPFVLLIVLQAVF
jgi:hypothetical protein